MDGLKGAGDSCHFQKNYFLIEKIQKIPNRKNGVERTVFD